MELTRIKYLRGELENECIATNELCEIEEAFAKLDPATLPDVPENAMASDMLNELENVVPYMEFVIYDWVKASFGESEANEPSWSIGELAKEINKITISRSYENVKGISNGDCKLGYLLDGDKYEVGNNNKTSDEH